MGISSISSAAAASSFGTTYSYSTIISAFTTGFFVGFFMGFAYFRSLYLAYAMGQRSTARAGSPAGVQIARRGEHRHVNRTDSSSSGAETATASGNVAAILPHPTTNSSVLEVVIQPLDTSNPTDETATSSTSSALTTAINTMASEMAPSASSSSNQTVTMADVLATTYSSLGNAISSTVANAIFTEFSS
ncbi:hypothetical protein CY35_01G034000 [Sphagnum magellanicum]|nr:hypothetical protein CY35_01G034000 [Sphagnum magellanicum]KAH9574040.1 hypothetical protein CY35_01G034000 [Sphagnum magellanicum]KAH9574041.1 hypothetical protein CY35_01G034000 [Sphagnum magellanicum]